MNYSGLKWVYPIGLLGLIGLVILILIYIIKPNYQQKRISSSYVWKLSLKYRKKKLPVSKLRNLLIFLCQFLVITTAAFIMVQPFLYNEQPLEFEKKIVIIDASANMRAVQSNGFSRFTNAVDEVSKKGQSTIGAGGEITVILADTQAKIITSRQTDMNLFNEHIETLTNEKGEPVACTYGQGDIDNAMLLAEEILVDNPSAEVTLYTATKYAANINGSDGIVRNGRVIIEDISNHEWNAALLNVTPSLGGTIGKEIDEETGEEKEVIVGEGHYSFEVEVASYGRDMEFTVHMSVNGVNLEGKDNQTAMKKVACIADKPTSITFTKDDFVDKALYLYRDATIYIDAADSFNEDNIYYLYGGIKETIKVQYVSSLQNSFFGGIIRGLKNDLKDYWNIELKEVRVKENELYPNDVELLGYDFYVFEHTMPFSLPTDGVVLLANPLYVPQNLISSLDDYGAVLGSQFRKADGAANISLYQGLSHPIMNYISASNINIAQYRSINLKPDSDFIPLMYCNGSPAFMIRDTANVKLAVLSFSVNQSNLPILMEFPILMYNLFSHFMPPTVSGYVHEIGAEINLNARGAELNVFGPHEFKDNFKVFPKTFTPQTPGTYNFMQNLISHKQSIDSVFVKISAAQSNFSRIEESLVNPVYPPPEPPVMFDLVIILAAIVLFLGVAERLLRIRDESV